MRFLSQNLTRFRTAVLTAVIGVLVGHAAFAQAVDVGLGAAASTGLSTVDLRTLIGRIVSYFLGLLGIIAVALIMYAGFTWMTANGNEEKIAQAKRIITNAVIGLFIIVAAFAIVQFVVRAITNGANGGNGANGTGGCPTGQICSLGGGSGGSGAFRITGIMPSGPGGSSDGSDKGWPKNYAISVNFTAPVAEGSVTPASVEVRKCNARVNGSGDAQAFDRTKCTTVVDGTRTVTGNKVVFKPSATPGDQPTDFEGDNWYSIKVQGGDVRDANGRTLVCPFLPTGPTGDISSTSAEPSLCDRAIAFNDQRDVAPPTVTLDAPVSPPAFCTSVPVPVSASANDDFLATAVDFLLDGGTANLTDAAGDPKSSDVNASLSKPFTSHGVFVDFPSLSEGQHTLSAIASDGVPQMSPVATRTFTVNPAHCCNEIVDEGETALNCGGSCGACSGTSCTTDAQCSSGYCDTSIGKCAERPVIDSIDPGTAGSGSFITIKGRFFGSGQGSITFLGGPEATDDVKMTACIPNAWTDTQIVVQIPSAARTGPIRVTTSAGQSDQTDDSRGPNFGAFNITGPTLPGICYVTPNVGAPGSEFEIDGTGFGGTIGTSKVTLGSFEPTISTGGWTEQKVTAIVPPAPEKSYPVQIAVGGNKSNTVEYKVSLSAAGAPSTPHVISVSPESGPVGSYVTINGSGFGRLKGTVRFKLGADVAIGEDPVCADNWHDNYVVVKVPRAYEGGLDTEFGAVPGIEHKIQVTTAPPFRASNDDISFRITNEPLRPGICSISPDNGPPGKAVEVSGTGFGAPSDSGASSSPQYKVDFFKGGSNTVTSDAYSFWQPSKIGTVVPGSITDRTTVPLSGPVTVTSNNLRSTNSIPFIVGSCQDGAVSCASGTTCCANGSCQASCEPVARESAYGWLFSTDVLPAFPVVVENALCSEAADASTPAVLQSPSPYKGSTDVCKNAEMRVEFSRRMRMDAATLASSIEFRECGEGESADCSSAPFTALRFDPRDCDGASPTDCKTLTFVPPSDYDGGTSYLKQKTWYQVRVISDPGNGKGMREGGGTEGRWLDGDYDRRAGGDYVYTFRVRDSADPCQLSDVFVDPPKTTITQDTDPTDFQAVPTAANCNSLRCAPNQPYSLDWLTETVFLKLLSAPSVPPAPDASFCTRPIMAIAESASTKVRASMAPLGTTLSKSGESDVTIKFAEPHVVSVTPDATCTEACINAAVIATFNVPMDPATLERPGNVELLKCRNASCTAPFLPLGSVVRTVGVTPPDGALGSAAVYKHVTITGTGDAANLEPATFYVVRIKGGANGVKSTSGVPLGGTNDGDQYVWKFRTKNDSSACLASSAVLSPAEATLFYVGQRQELSVRPFGSPDACSNAGQELIASDFVWNWTLPSPDPAVSGFVDGNALTPISSSPVATLVDTAATPNAACTDRCLLRGSQNAVPQCGNGKVEGQYEECDPSSAGCSSRCLDTGTAAPTCGNGTINAGENCESVGGVFPSGCKQPGSHVDGFNDALGCVLTGSSTAKNAKCGDGLVGDGEACDDGNTSNGDGCSADCLKEGTLPSCLGAAPGSACVNFCGNGKVEPGEDAACEPNPGAAGCDRSTCLKTGSPTCSASGGSGCCGNGVVEKGEEPSCETDPNAKQFCTDRCLFKGSSGLYAEPSFCGDSIVGPGEQAACEQAPDGRIDAMQVVEARPQAGFDATSANMSTVHATTEGIADANAGTAKISLSCTCNTLPVGERDAFCASFDDGANGLACSSNGCCAPRPKVSDVSPVGGTNDACRNSSISVSFDQLMDPASVQGNVLVGYDNGTAACPSGTTTIAAADGSAAANRSLWARIVGAIADFVSHYVLQPVFGAAPGAPDAHHVFCAVDTKITVTNDGDPTPTATTAHVSIVKALPADKWIVIRVLPGARALSGVAVDPQGYRAYFGTGKDICTVSSVEVTPRSTLFSTSSQPPATLVARAISSGREEIVPTADYGWRWQWTPQPATEPSVSPIVLTPAIDTFGAETAFAEARVRGTKSADAPSGYKPTNGQAVAQASAIINATTDIHGEADVTVFLCENPWPARRVCPATGKKSLPWDPSLTDACTVGTTYWSAFYDPQTNYSFYYCRDAQKSGDVGAALPAFRETPVIVSPGRDIVKEYLFTYDTGVFAPTKESQWQDDAIGLRISTNPEHFGAAQWYSSKGFKGAATPMTVDGFDAVKDGRTVYANAAANAGGPLGGNLYTNIGVFSYTDGASPETVSIFNQVLANTDFLTVRGFSMADSGVCLVGAGKPAARCTTNDDCRVDAAGSPDPGKSAFTCDTARAVCKNGAGQDDTTAGIAIACGNDLDCQTDANGDFIKDSDGKPTRTAFVCDAPKQKLIRDVRRWADLQTMRAELSASRANGALPKLDAGSFLATMSNSTWPSWTAALGPKAGAVLPRDPVNLHAWCDGANRQGDICWDDKAQTYLCPAGSHVYDYEYFQDNAGANFRLRADLETTASSLNATWRGNTCIERTTANCLAPDGLCEVVNGACNYKVGKLYVGGVNRGPNCTGTTFGTGGVCGDGTVSPSAGEVCEPGQGSVGQCTDGNGKPGNIAQVCASDCKSFVNKAGATCQLGRCGDGVVNGSESCDEGTLNGTYGHCDAGCTGAGFRCGDGTRQPGEACDCGSRNGKYYFNGILQTAGASCSSSASGTNKNSCAWDCSSAGPRCGDGVVNGTETCDGGFQTSKGFCTKSVTSLSGSQSACSTDADCSGGEKCGHYCPTPEQTNRRACNGNAASTSSDDGAACTWAQWACTAAGSCGNGVKETGEECDDGNTNNADGCIIDPVNKVMCKVARCGDGYVDPAIGEQCDEGNNNNAICSPKYGLSCTYCSATCKTVAVTGGFCGDNTVQTPSSTPQGPEECDNTQGLSDDYVCVSTRPETQSYGLRTGTATSGAGSVATCAAGNCLRTCQQPDSQVCQQSCDWTSTGGNHDYYSGHVAPDTYWLDTVNYTSIGIRRPLCDACDPDMDDDGVPNTSPAECDAKDPKVHGAYNLTYVGIDNQTHAINIAPAVEICDGKDNDCNGQTDNIYILKGKVVNARTGAGLDGAGFTIYCGDRKVKTGISDNSGNYQVEAIDDGNCEGEFTIVPQSNSQACGDADDVVSVPISTLKKCVPSTVPTVIAVPRPGSDGDGAVATTFLKWGDQASGAPEDLDFHVRTSDGTELGYDKGGTNNYGPACSPNSPPPYACSNGLVFDHDDTDWSGPETITFKTVNRADAYKFYVKNYSGKGNWGSKSNPPPEIRFFDNACDEQKLKLAFPSGYKTSDNKPWWEAWTIGYTNNNPTGKDPHPQPDHFFIVDSPNKLLGTEPTVPAPVIAPPAAPSGSFCGDGQCNNGEICGSGFGNSGENDCTEDCCPGGVTPGQSYCGDGSCNGSEVACYGPPGQGCKADCGSLPGCTQ